MTGRQKKRVKVVMMCCQSLQNCGHTGAELRLCWEAQTGSIVIQAGPLWLMIQHLWRFHHCFKLPPTLRWDESKRGTKGEAFWDDSTVPQRPCLAQGEFHTEQTVKCVLSNEAPVQVSHSLFSALLVRCGCSEHVFSLYYSPLFLFIFLFCLLPLL